MSPYNAKKYGKVTFSVYDISKFFEDENGDKIQMTSKQFEDKRDSCLQRLPLERLIPKN